jgi:aminoglycoside 6'-N-acetyltransferase
MEARTCSRQTSARSSAACARAEVGYRRAMGDGGIHAAIEPLDGRLVRLRPAEPTRRGGVSRDPQRPNRRRWWQSATGRRRPREGHPGRDRGVGDRVRRRRRRAASRPTRRPTAVPPRVDRHRPREWRPGPRLWLGRRPGRRRWLFEARGHHRITIDPAASNARAIRAYERVGFSRSASCATTSAPANRTWHDGPADGPARRRSSPTGNPPRSRNLFARRQRRRLASTATAAVPAARARGGPAGTGGAGTARRPPRLRRARPRVGRRLDATARLILRDPDLAEGRRPGGRSSALGGACPALRDPPDIRPLAPQPRGPRLHRPGPQAPAAA